MRLIDADELKKADFQDFSNTDVMTAIDNMPTAYDKKNVVEQLKVHSQNIALIYSTDDGIDYTEDVGLSIDKAIEIVEKGGAE